MDTKIIFERIAIRISQSLLLCVVTGLSFIQPFSTAFAQQTPATSVSPTPLATASPTAMPAPTPIPLAEVVSQAEAASAAVTQIEADLKSDQVSSTVGDDLPSLTNELEALRPAVRTVTSPEILLRVQSITADIKRTREESGKQRVEILKLQSRVAELDERMTQAPANETYFYSQQNNRQ